MAKGTTALAKNEEVVARKKMSISRKQMTIQNIIRNKKKIRFDLAIQRNNVWKETSANPQKTKLIDSILRNFPIPQIFVIASDDGFMWLADGKQRWTTVFAYRNNEFPLAKGTPPVEHENEDGELVEYDVEGKFFKDLDKPLQEQFVNYEMDIREVRNATPEQIEEMFVRLNNGTPLTKMELTRATLGTAITEQIIEIANKEFFSEMAFLSDNARNRFVDQEMIIQTLMLAMGRDTGISSRDIANFVKPLNESGIPEDTMKIMIGTTEYLKDAFEQFVNETEDGKKDMPILDKILKKIHIPILFMTAIEAIQHEVEPEVFGQWAKSFLFDKYTPGHGTYGKHCVAGSAKKDNVKGRLNAMKNDFTKNIEAIKEKWESEAVIREEKKRQEEAKASAVNSSEDNNDDTEDNNNNMEDTDEKTEDESLNGESEADENKEEKAS